MGEVTPGPPLLLAGLFSSAPGDGARSLIVPVVFTGADGAGDLEAALLLKEAFPSVDTACCSTLSWLLESFFASASAGTGMVECLGGLGGGRCCDES